MENQIKVSGFHIYAPQDPSVGLPSVYWEVTGNFYFDGKAHLEEFRKSLRDLFANYADDGRTKVRTIEEEEEEDRLAQEIEDAAIENLRKESRNWKTK